MVREVWVLPQSCGAWRSTGMLASASCCLHDLVVQLAGCTLSCRERSDGPAGRLCSELPGQVSAYAADLERARALTRQRRTDQADRIDGVHSEEDAGALVEVSCCVITATWLTSKAFGRRRKEARRVAGFRDPLEEVGTFGAGLMKPTARVAAIQHIEGARKESVCKRQVPTFTGSALW
ncbi:hypothetical protein HPB52_000676 [Rhipicephalus sanguineus]|uniref:Uncharacterized protein n=1 Tax=Rhipicephalus sanguineus TaxID=34632 RepID=A0A9D4QHH0_RHISA|nr:hypothetical protein HPB52_000676 [Rhipicephalus sanguineus]